MHGHSFIVTSPQRRPENQQRHSILPVNSNGGLYVKSTGEPTVHVDVARRRRRCEWEQPYTLSWRSASADDAEWMSGKSRARLAPS